MRFSTLRNLMLSMLVLGVAGSVAGVGTFATFNATTTSTGNTFSSANVTFRDILNGNGANVCTSTSGGTAAGAGCTTALGTAATMVPGDTKYGTVVLTNQGNVSVSAGLTVTDSASNVLTSTAIGTAGTSPVSAGLGLFILECTTSGGTDEDCTATDATGKFKVIYGSCTGAVTTLTPNGGLPVTSSTYNTTGLLDNGLNVKTGASSNTECWGGNTATALNALTSISLVNPLATSANLSLAMVIYFPPSTSTASYQNLSANSLTYNWIATQLPGAAR
jgi:predicted ribosomally synthesized peptide with SipW-like signal peptide